MKGLVVKENKNAQTELKMLLLSYYAFFLILFLEIIQTRLLHLSKKDFIIFALLFILQCFVFSLIYKILEFFIKPRVHFYLFYILFFLGIFYVNFLCLQEGYSSLGKIFGFLLKYDLVSKAVFFMNSHFPMKAFDYVFLCFFGLFFIFSLKFQPLRMTLYFILYGFSIFIFFLYFLI